MRVMIRAIYVMVSEVFVLSVLVMASLSFKPPACLVLDGPNVANNWTTWHRSWKIYKTALELSATDEAIQCAAFLHVAGPTAQRVYASWTLAAGEEDKIAVLEAKFEQFCAPKKNVIISLYLFNSKSQGSAECFAPYLTGLRDLIKQCEYGSLEDDLLRDRIVCGVSDSKVRERLLRTADLTLQIAIDTCTAAEASADQLKTLHTGDSSADVHAINSRRFHCNKRAQQSASRDTCGRPTSGKFNDVGVDRRHSGSSVAGEMIDDNTPAVIKCAYCTYDHQRGKCPAYKQNCRKCGKQGNFSKSIKCPKRKSRHVEFVETDTLTDNTDYTDEDKDINPNVHPIDSEYFSDAVHIDNVPNSDFDDFYIDMGLTDSRDWTKLGLVNGHSVNFKLNSGAQVNIIPEKCLKNGSYVLKKSNDILKSYTGHVILNIGYTNVDVKFGNQTVNVVFNVVRGDVKPVLGRA